MIDFNQAYQLGHSEKYIQAVLQNGHTAGDGQFTKACATWIQSQMQVDHVLMTSSCTAALEMACLALGLSEDDEVLLPSFTYPSTGNAVLMAGGKPVLVPCNHALLIDTNCLESYISAKTRAIIAVHYGGRMADMKALMTLAKKHDLLVIEDAAQGFLSMSDQGYAGTIGDFGCFSFHGTKDIIAGEGGAIVINRPEFIEKCEAIRLKGTSQAEFRRGQILYYEWVSQGSSYSPSELNMALLLGQLELADEIVAAKNKIFKRYEDHFNKKSYDTLKSYSSRGNQKNHNGHLYYIEFSDRSTAQAFIAYMKSEDIAVYTHFVPLNESSMGNDYSHKDADFKYENQLGKRLVRLPSYASLTMDDQDRVLSCIDLFMEGQR